MQKRTKDVLFVHTNFPGQFGFIAQALKDRGWRCAAIASQTGRALGGIPLLRWQTPRGSTSGIFPPAARAENNLIRGRAAAECALALQRQGFDPDLIIGHPGWGETLLLKEIFPRARQILYGEFYFRTRGVDVGFDPEFGQPSIEERFRIYAKNATIALAFAEADRIVCPTPFQASLLPKAFRSRTILIHEGVDTDRVRPGPTATLTLDDGRVLDRSVPVITFINRQFEPLRGFHIFMRALPRVLAELPDAHAVLIGADEPARYGMAAPNGATWKGHLLPEVAGRLDMSRVHFTGRVPYDRMLAALSISAAHVYYTYPFVLSWSLLEAMACECLVIGSDTAPVRDAVEHDVNGLLLDFFDVDALAQALVAACRQPDRFSPLRKAARRTILDGFDRKRQCEPAWLRLVDDVLSEERE
ncbi:MAG TPA: glycosyltransferase [Microvirga sp.]|nr:glycosyltransferase [Microvirga sp.]